MGARNKLSNIIYDFGGSTVKYSYKFAYNLTVRPLNYFIFVLTSFLRRSFEKAKSTGEKLVLTIVLCLSILWISVISYASFYNLYLPTAEISRPVHLGFSVCPQGIGICSFPSANVSLTERNPIKEVLGSGQVYSVVIDLEIPDTQVNRDLGGSDFGMFMVELRMYDRYYHISATSKRSALYKYKSLPLRLLDLMVWSPLYFLGAYDEKQTITIEMFSTFTDDFYHPSVGANIEVQNHAIQIYSCQLKFYAKFTGLKYFLHYWPLTSAICGISFNIFICVIFLAVAAANKREMFAEIEQTLSSRSDLQIDSDSQPSSVNSSDGKPRKQVSGRDIKTCHQATQTVSEDEEGDDDDGIESFSLPVIQEPADFGDDLDGKDEELIAELRHRRVQ